jgi:hypothetical protein
MHSLQIFLKEKAQRLGIRISTENFGRFDNIITVPLYGISELDRVLGET